MTLSTFQKAVLSILVAVLIISLTVAAWAVAKWGFARSAASPQPRRITATDSAEVKAKPDTAVVTFGVVTREKSAEGAASANAVKTAAVVETLVNYGIRKSGIRTADYSLEPQTDYKRRPPAIVGYRASNTVEVTTRDLAGIGKLIDAAIAAGANNVRGASFDVEDKTALREQALALAVRKADGKARVIAKSAGVRLGPVVSASESLYEEEPAGEAYCSWVVACPPARKLAMTLIEPGETTVSAQVKIVYSLR